MEVGNLYMGKHCLFVLFIIGGFFALVRCNSPVQSLSSPDDKKMEYSTKLHDDSSSINPYSVIKHLSEIRPQVVDSFNFYKIGLLLASSYYHANALDSALILNQEVIDYYHRSDKTEKKVLLAGDAYNNRGVCLQHTNHNDSAIICYIKAYELLNNISGKELLPSVCINLADCYYFNGEYSQTSYYYRKALFISDSLGMETLKPAIYSGLAQLYQELENYEQSEEFFKKAEEYWDIKTDHEKFFFANTRGNYYYKTQNYRQALDWFKRADMSAKKLSQAFAQAIAEGNMGEIYILMGEVDSARYFLDSARKLLGKYYYQPSFKFYFDGLYASLALLENNLPEAEKILVQPFDTLEVNPQYIYLHNRRMQDLYLKKQDYKKAYHYRNMAEAYNDSLRNVRIHNNIAEIGFRYQQDTTLIKKDMQIALSENKASQWQKVALLSIIISLLFICLIVGVILYRRRIRELKYQKYLATITELRMEIVRNRLSPHFVFNALNAIMPALDKYQELEKPFRLLIQLLRNNIKASEQIAVSLEEEIKIVKDYLELQAFRDSSIITINWHLDKDLTLQTLIPSMSIQIPVENAVKYAFNATTSDPTIEIQLIADEEFLYIRIEDNGIGYIPGQTSNDLRGTGNGIKMLYKTIDLLNSQNEKKMSLLIENISNTTPHKHGTKVSLVIPSKYKFEL